MINNKKNITEILKQRILVLDGAMGTMIQRYNLSEADYRSTRFANWPVSLKGNNDLLSITQPMIIAEIHNEYLKSGADIIETNTFNAQAISLEDYQMSDLVYEINYNAAKIAKESIKNYHTNVKPRFVAGSIGPTNKSLSLVQDSTHSCKRNIDFIILSDAYKKQVEALIDGGVDILLVETIFDTLNAKACLYAIQEVFSQKNTELPVMISVSINDMSSRTLSGQTLSAFVNSISHFPYLSIGLNCALGPDNIKSNLIEISNLSDAFVSVYPNAGLPDDLGHYSQTPSEMAKIIQTYMDEKLVNIIGGCCGTTPQHIKYLADIAVTAKPKPLHNKTVKKLILSGTETVEISHQSYFIHIGERTNVAGSAKFKRCIVEKKYDEALKIASDQITNGANIIDISFDDGLLDAKSEMKNFLRMIASEPSIAKVPIMLDSSDFEVIELGLQNIQGKSIVNSISLKNGEEDFCKKASTIHKYGAAMVVMAFDERGQATDFETKICICERAYNILVNRLKIPPQDIIFDCNILSIGTGLKEHANYAKAFMKAVTWIKRNLKGSYTSGGISNLSFAFRGNHLIRETLHSVFLYHAIKAGLDMGIVHAGNLPIYNLIDPELRSLCENLIFNTDTEAAEKLLTYATGLSIESNSENEIVHEVIPLQIEDRLKNALINGQSYNIENVISEALLTYQNPTQIIEGPLMEAMHQIGELFREGCMFLPQVIKSARVMKEITTILYPEINKRTEHSSTPAAKILIATVNGDVHDIGKNIASIVLSCNNFDIIDLGIMVNKHKIVDEAIAKDIDIIGLSGLISPSLYEMEMVAQELEKRKLTIPLIISGATTSPTHTALKIAPVYSAPVIHIPDVSKAVEICKLLLDKNKKQAFIEQIQKEQQEIREEYYRKKASKVILSIEEARKKKFITNTLNATITIPQKKGIVKISPSISELISLFNFSSFFARWKIPGKYPSIFEHPHKGKQAKKLYHDAMEMLHKIVDENLISAKAVVGILPAYAKNETIYIKHNQEVITFEFPRNQNSLNENNFCLADFILESNSSFDDFLGFFVLSAGLGLNEAKENFRNVGDDYSAIMIEFIAEVLAEAFAEYIHIKIINDVWAFSYDDKNGQEKDKSIKLRGIRPAPGYPICPDHSFKKKIFELLDAENEIGVKLSENYAMTPTASLCGFYFAHPESRYFEINN